MTIDIKFDRTTKMGDIRRVAKKIKIDHELALQLWATKQYHERLLSLLILDKKQLTQTVVNSLVHSMEEHPNNEQIQLMDWLFANQLSKFKQGITWIQSWENSEFPLQRRTYWYYQARLRWMGNKKQNNSAELLTTIEQKIELEDPKVQWAMNLVAGWIGVYEDDFQVRCIKLGEKTGLYKDEKVHRGCTPNYLPDFIAIEREKRGKP